MARRRGPARWPLVALVVVFVAAGAYTLLGRDDGEPEGPPTPMVVPVRDVEGDFDPITAGAGDYEVTYRVEGFTADGGAVIDRERRAVRPPYASRVETRPDDGEGDVTFLQVSNLGVLQTGREDEEPAILASEPAVAPGDARIVVDIEAAVDAGVLTWQEQERTVLDRRCQVFRTGGPIDIATLAPPDEGEDSWADLCIGDDGLLLHEEWVIGGDPFRRRIAIEIDESPTFDDAQFDPTGLIPEGGTGGVLAELTPDSQPPGVPHYTLASAPDGFRLRGRFAYTPPRAQIDVTQPTPPLVALVLDVYEAEDGGGGIVVVANGGSTNRQPIFEVSPDDDVTVDLGPQGTGEIVLGLHQNEVRTAFDQGRFLRVWGTLPVDELAAIAAAVTPTTDPDAEITPLDD